MRARDGYERKENSGRKFQEGKRSICLLLGCGGGVSGRRCCCVGGAVVVVECGCGFKDGFRARMRLSR